MRRTEETAPADGMLAVSRRRAGCSGPCRAAVACQDRAGADRRGGLGRERSGVRAVLPCAPDPADPGGLIGRRSPGPQDGCHRCYQLPGAWIGGRSCVSQRLGRRACGGGPHGRLPDGLCARGLLDGAGRSERLGSIVGADGYVCARWRWWPRGLSWQRRRSTRLV